ncbi:hypothetical protein Tco_0120905 [Tanacetum coccineum]
MMTALELVNRRVTYQVDVCTRESSEFCTRHHDAQKDRAAMRAKIEVLRRERLSYEQESMETRQALARSEAYYRALEARVTVLETEKMAPKRATRPSVSVVLAARDATRNGIDSHTSGTGVRGSERVARECTYQDFMKCKPLYFKGTEGVVELTQWFERMETVFRISNCSMENQVKFSTCTLLASALTWWNSHVMTVTHDAAYSMTWVTDVASTTNVYKNSALLFVRNIHEESDKIEVMDKRVSTMAERQAENKRKFENTSQNNQNQHQQQNKRQNTGQAYTASNSDRKSYAGSKPLCSKSGKDWAPVTDKYMEKGFFPIFLAHVTTKEVEDKSEKKRLEDVPIVQDFLEVFPEDLPGLPPTRQVEFQIDLVPGAAPVARAPYRLAPSEMKELSEQLKELSEKGFIRPSSSP